VAGLKPGQIRADGRVYEPYQVLRPGPRHACRRGTHTMKQTRGFTLIELAIVMVIITILIGGLTMPLSAQIQARRIAETNKTAGRAQERRSSAMRWATWKRSTMTWIQTPPTRTGASCPAPTPTWTGSSTELRIATAMEAAWLTKAGSPRSRWAPQKQDAWGNRLRYRVTASFADASPGFFNTDDGDIQICSGSNCATGMVAENVPLVLLSHGPNGRGALSLGGVKMADPSGADELENTDADAEFVSRVPTTADHPNGEFDDLVVWLSSSLLTGRIRL
jgi:prepilin-type N-terminal cleavage/methylation domain-containing protein